MASSKLFEPLKIGNMELKHRVVMAPLTRQRASTPGTLLITEATFISQQAAGDANVPGIWSKDQIAGWKQVADAVHAKGSYIYVQLWALGRVAKPDVAKAEGFTIKAPSSIPTDGLPAPAELTAADIESFVADYARAARNAIEAGFDGVELHGANGYLVDQFIQDVSNQRTDDYGGSIKNRSRFPLRVLEALVAAVGSDRVGLRLSPWSDFQGMRMADPVPQFTHLVSEVRKLKLAYLHIVEARVSGNADTESADTNDFIFKAWQKASPVLVAGGLKPDTARALLEKDHDEVEVAAVFGRYFLANPDLPFRIQKGLELNQYNRHTFYDAESPVGYIDYPFSQEWLSVQA